jgi:hypothetical protein
LNQGSKAKNREQSCNRLNFSRFLWQPFPSCFAGWLPLGFFCCPAHEALAGKTFMAEGYCVKCKAKREIADGVEEVMKNGRKAIKGKCPTCGTVMFKILGGKATPPAAPATPAVPPAPSAAS